MTVCEWFCAITAVYFRWSDTMLVHFLSVYRLYYWWYIAFIKIDHLLKEIQTIRKQARYILDLFLWYNYCINEYLVRSCSVSINSCKSEPVKLSLEATPKVTNSQNSCNGWASACTKDQLKETSVLHSQTMWKVSTNLQYNQYFPC